MTPRQIRRAAERQALKAARKAGQPNPVPPTPAGPTEAQLAANRANSLHSTGPRTDAGKQVSSHNALKTGLTGQTVLLPTDDIAAYESLLNAYIEDFQPATPEEKTLVQSVVDCTWRMRRILNLEFALYAKGSIEFADQFQDLDPATRSQMIQVETFLKYEKSIRNLNTQEARLQRRLVKDTSELHRLKAERQQQEAEIQAFMEARAKRAATTPAAQPAATPTEFGFEFSNPPSAPDNPESAPLEQAA